MATWSVKRALATSDGESLAVAADGAGPPLVLLHEWGSSHRIWEPIARRLSDGFTVYRWNARGHGGHRPRSLAATTIGRMADDLADLIGGFQMPQPILVGHSMGALTIWEHVARHGCDHLAGIVILDQSPRLVTDADWRFGIYGDWPRARDATFVADLERDFVATVVRLVSLGLNGAARRRYEQRDPAIDRLERYLAGLDPDPLIAVWRTLSAGDWRPVLPRIRVPTLLIHGDESHYYPPGTGETVRAMIPGATLLTYAGADHAPHVAQPVRFVRDLRAFAARHARG